HLPGAVREQIRLEEGIGKPAAEGLGLPDGDGPSLTVDELVRARRIRDRAGFGTGDHVSILAGDDRGSAPRSAPLQSLRCALIAARLGPRGPKEGGSAAGNKGVWSIRPRRATVPTTDTCSRSRCSPPRSSRSRSPVTAGSAVS